MYNFIVYAFLFNVLLLTFKRESRQNIKHYPTTRKFESQQDFNAHDQGNMTSPGKRAYFNYLQI